MIKDDEARPSNEFHQFTEPHNNPVHNSPPDILILNQINPVPFIRHIWMYFNIFRLSLGFPVASLFQVSPPKPYIHFCSPYTCHMHCLSPLLSFHRPNKTWRSVQIMKYHITQFSSALYYFLPLGPDVSFSTLFLNTLNLCSSVSVRDLVSHPHKATGKNCSSATMHVFCLSPGALYEIASLFEGNAVVFAVWLNTSRCTSCGPMTKEPELRGM